MQYPFTSPIGKDAIAFYRFYIEDTVKIQRDSCIHLHFLPNNQMDFGFRGDIYILKDSTYHVRRCELTLPKQSSVNWVKNLRINQEFERLDNGDWVLTEDDMVTELSFAKFIQEAIVIKNNRYTGYSFDELPKKMFKGKRTEIKEPDAGMRGKSFWNEYRQVELTKSEDSMGSFVKNIQNIKALYEKEWEGIIGNCDTLLFLGGGNEPTSLEFMSKLLGKETLDTRTRGQTKGRNGSSS